MLSCLNTLAYVLLADNRISPTAIVQNYAFLKEANFDIA